MKANYNLSSLFALLGFELPDVELELFAFENVSVGATDLARTRRDGRQDTTRLELLLQKRVNLGRLFPVVVFLLGLLGSLLVEERFVGFGQFDSLLPAEGRGVVGLVPLAEGRSVDRDDGVLDERLGTHQLVVAGVVDGIDDTRFTGDRLRTPREVARVQSEGSSFDVSSSNSDQMDAVGADFGHRSRTTQLILSLLLVSGPLASGLPLLVPFRLRNSHF